MIQVYVSKQNFDVQKTLRYFKERRIAVQVMDVARRAPGLRELETLARALGGMRALLDTADKRVLSSPIQFIQGEALLAEELLAHPGFLVSPIVRNGRVATIGYAPEVWKGWLAEM